MTSKYDPDDRAPGPRGVGADARGRAYKYTLVQVFDHVSYILLYAGVTATGGSIEWVVVWGA